MRIHKKIHLFEGALLVALIVSLGASMVPFTRQCEQISTKVIRLHILANSDSSEDQALKLEVRDRILEETGARLNDAQTRTDAEQQLEGLLPEIEQLAAKQIAASGYDYAVHAELTDMYFTTRTYDTGTLPAGTYRALRLTIGEGAGHNWWCVVFPPMCVSAALQNPGGTPEQGLSAAAAGSAGSGTSAASGQEPAGASSGSASPDGSVQLDDVLSPGELDIVENANHYEVRLKVVEWWEQLTAWLRGK